MFVNLHDCRLITASVAVIWCYLAVSSYSWILGRTRRRVLTRKDRDNVPILRPVVSLHDQLMGSRDQGEAVVMVESL